MPINRFGLAVWTEPFTWDTNTLYTASPIRARIEATGLKDPEWIMGLHKIPFECVVVWLKVSIGLIDLLMEKDRER